MTQPAHREWKGPQSLYVGGITEDVTEAMLLEKFDQAGPVHSIQVCEDDFLEGRDYAYVNFRELADAQRALDTMSENNVAKSAFEITSISDAPPDTEMEMEGGAMSRETDDLRQSLADGMREGTKAYNGEQEGEELTSVTPLVPASEANSAATSTSASPKVANLVQLSSVPANGPSQSTRSRFKRITCYQRGRWNGKDTRELEGRLESELKMVNIPSTLRQSDIATQGSSSPVPYRRAIIPAPSVKAVPVLYIRSRTESNNLLHSHGNTCSEVSSSVDCRDAPILDRIGPTVESTNPLSCTPSMLSVVKLVGEEERGREADQESMITLAPSTRTPDLVAKEAQSTSAERLHHFCACPDCSSRFQDRTAKQQHKLLGQALNHIREQLSQFDSYLKILEDRDRLHEEKCRLEEENSRLRNLLASRGVNVPHKFFIA